MLEMDFNPEKDRRIFELQSENAELSLDIDSFEERFNSQLEISETLQNELEELKSQQS